MQNQQRSPSDPNTLRVLVVGETKVGKTLLIRRLCHQVFCFSTAATSVSKGSDEVSRRDSSMVDTTEEDFYFAPQWGPTIGFEVDCLVRDTYGVRDTCTQNSHSNRYMSPTGQPDDEIGTPFFPKTPITVNGCGGGGRIVRRNSSRSSPAILSGARGAYTPCMSFRSVDSGVASPAGPSSVTSRLNPEPLDSTNYSSGATTIGPDDSLTGQSPGHSNQRPVAQTVELYELGGARTFSPDCTLPLPLLEFDGIMFVYDRANTESTTRLLEWYAHMKHLFSSGAAPGVEGRRPRVMLVGTKLTASSSLSKMLGRVDGRGARDEADVLSDGDEFPPDDALMDPEVRLQAQRQLGKRRRNRGNGHRPGFVKRKLGGLVQASLTFLRLALSPSLVLSEQYQEERSTRSFRFLFRLLEAFAAFFMWIERIIMYCMAVVLFGFYQGVVKVRQPTVRASLDTIKEDRFFSAQCHVCYLFDRHAFESSADEIIGFFDTLHREKLSRSAY